jgi:predicted  nucleic acid-binding Zn-ribbon protein
MGQESRELKDRVEAKKKQIKADIAKAKADARGEKNDTIEKLQKKLQGIESAVKDGFDDMSEAASKKLNEWLK